MANRNNKTDKTGRTFWDYSHENPKIVISLIVVLALLVVVLVFKDYSFKSPYISVAPKIKSDSIILDKKENIKPKEQEAQKGLTPNKAITKEQPKSSSKYDIKDNEFKGPTQIGDNNVQNIDTKQRVANDSIIKVITADISDKNQIIVIDRQDQMTETNTFAKSLVTALKSKGF